MGWPALLEDNPVVDSQRRLALFLEAEAEGTPAAKAAVIDYFTWATRGASPALSESEKDLLQRLASTADVDQTIRLMRLVRFAGAPHLPWAWHLLNDLPLESVAEIHPDELMDLLTPTEQDGSSPPNQAVTYVLKSLVRAPELELHHDAETWDQLLQNFPYEIYQLIVDRIQMANSQKKPSGYQPIPHGYRERFNLPALGQHGEYSAICADLWHRVTNQEEPGRIYWVELFQAVVMQDGNDWPARLENSIASCSSVDALSDLARLIRFDGSLVIFRYPQITRSFLRRAASLGGNTFQTDFRARLYRSAGPQIRSSTGGILDQELDYVEAEAAKAAKACASDELLGPFYRWIAEVERQRRAREKIRAEAEMVAWE